MEHDRGRVSGLVPWSTSHGDHLMNFLVIILNEAAEIRKGPSRSYGKLLLSFTIEKPLYENTPTKVLATMEHLNFRVSSTVF